jgi:hypothetical protein
MLRKQSDNRPDSPRRKTLVCEHARGKKLPTAFGSNASDSAFGSLQDHFERPTT